MLRLNRLHNYSYSSKSLPVRDSSGMHKKSPSYSAGLKRYSGSKEDLNLGSSKKILSLANKFIMAILSYLDVYKNKKPVSNEVFQNKLSELKQLAEKIQALDSSEELADYDLQTAMPKPGGDYRAWQMGHLKKMSHEILVSKEMKDLILFFKIDENSKKLSEIDKVLVRELSLKYEKAKNIPPELVEELEAVTAKAHNVWKEAKEKNDFNLFAPSLERIISLKRQIAKLIGYERSPYDALLDMYEPGMTTKKLDAIFSKLKEELIPFIKRIQSSSHQIDTSILNKSFTQEEQMKLAREIAEYMGFDFSRGRLGRSAHPISFLVGYNDSCLTISSHNDLWNPIDTPLHEGGHGLYDQGISEEFSKTPLYEGSSIALHESQARFYQVIIGKSLPFWKHYYPILQ